MTERLISVRKIFLLSLFIGCFVLNVIAQNKLGTSKTKQKKQQEVQQGVAISLLGWSIDSNTKTLPPLLLETKLLIAKTEQSRYRGIVIFTNIGEESISLPFSPSFISNVNDRTYRSDKNIGGLASLTVKDSKGVDIKNFTIQYYGNTRKTETLLTLKPGESWFIDFHKESYFSPFTLKPGKYFLEANYWGYKFDLPEIVHAAGVAHAKTITSPIVFEVKETTILE